jgi:hypothetical protein
MLTRDQVIGCRIVRIFGDNSLSEDSWNYCEFLYVLDNNIAFRMPVNEGNGLQFEDEQVTASHKPLSWPTTGCFHRWWNLWRATISDVLVPNDPEDQVPDSGQIILSSGYALNQLSGGPPGISPGVNLIWLPNHQEHLTSVWNH